MAALLGLGLGLRAWGLAAEPVWYDELISFEAHGCGDGSLADYLRIIRFQDATAMPGYYLVQYGWAQLFGSGLVALRALGLLVDAISGLLVAVLGRRWFGSVAGLTALALFVLSPLLTFYAQELRPYALLTLCGLISTAAISALAARPHDLRRGGVAACAAIPPVLCHPIAVYLPIAQLCWLFLSRRWGRGVSIWFYTQVGLAATWIAWVANADYGAAEKALDWIEDPSPVLLLRIVTQVDLFWPDFPGALAVATALIAGALALLLRRARFTALDRTKLLLCLCCWLLPALGVYLQSYLLAPALEARYLLYTAPFLAMLLGAALHTVPRFTGRCCIALGLCALPALAQYQTERPLRTDWHTIIDWVEAHRAGEHAHVIAVYLIEGEVEHHLRGMPATVWFSTRERAPRDLADQLGPLRSGRIFVVSVRKLPDWTFDPLRTYGWRVLNEARIAGKLPRYATVLVRERGTAPTGQGAGSRWLPLRPD